ERILREDGETEENLLNVRLALIKVGDVERLEGNRDAAADHYARAVELSQRAVEVYGESSERLQDVSVSLIKAGDMHRAAGDKQAAAELYRQSLKVGERIIMEFGETPEILRSFSVLCSRMAQTEPESVRKWLERGRQCLLSIIERGWETPETRNELAMFEHGLAKLK
ncbi:MAG TPA: tetratricopeptide repeat protein, partial [Planctomycetaceae bacterium]|nr:tetratricopeptide repeat protein [Planctomycetaceae bacterium]